MSENNKKKTVKKRRRRSAASRVFALLVSLVCFAAAGYLVIQLIRIDILPVTYLLIVSMICLLLLLLLALSWVFKTKRPFPTFICGLLTIVLGVCYGVGGYYLQETEEMFDKVTDLTDKVANTVTTYVMSDKNITDPSQMQGMTVGVLSSLEPEATAGAIAQLESKGANITTMDFDDPYTLVDYLYAGYVDAIAMPEQYHDQINLIANDYNKYNALTTFTTTPDQYIYYTDRDEITINPSNPVSNIMKDPFVVLISGNDSYGSLASASRSDVNMLVAVNPSTAQILMVSLPRDTYVEISCKSAGNACDDVEGQYDKLTHTGVYGIGTVESSIENLLGISINYTVQVNFSSLINIVDAIGGVDVYVEEGLEVDTFYANGTEGVQAGWNHLDGERALAFARERYAYVDGDNQRVKNQQIVLKSIISAMMSPDMIVRYPDVITALSTAFETNMSSQELKSLLTLEIVRMPKWNIQTYTVSGESSAQMSAVAQDLVSVVIPYQNQLDYAKKLIDEVESGQTVEVDAEEGAPDTSESPAATFEQTNPNSYQYQSYNGYNQTYDDYNYYNYGYDYSYDTGYGY